jgi:hypothetical protein
MGNRPGCDKCGPKGKCVTHAKTAAELSIYYQGALTFLELRKKAAAEPSFAGFLDPAVFFTSFGWFQTRKKRGYSEAQIREFVDGFAGAAALAAEESR